MELKWKRNGRAYYAEGTELHIEKDFRTNGYYICKHTNFVTWEALTGRGCGAICFRTLAEAKRFVENHLDK